MSEPTTGDIALILIVLIAAIFFLFVATWGSGGK